MNAVFKWLESKNQRFRMIRLRVTIWLNICKT